MSDNSTDLVSFTDYEIQHVPLKTQDNIGGPTRLTCIQVVDDELLACSGRDASRR